TFVAPMFLLPCCRISIPLSRATQRPKGMEPKRYPARMLKRIASTARRGSGERQGCQDSRCEGREIWSGFRVDPNGASFGSVTGFPTFCLECSSRRHFVLAKVGLIL